MIKDYIDFVPTRLLVSTFSVSVLLDAVRLRGRHLNWLRHSWTRLKINHKLENNLCPRWWILFWEIMLGMCLMQGNQRFCHFLQRLLTSMSFSFLVLFFYLINLDFQLLYLYFLDFPKVTLGQNWLLWRVC